MQVDRNAVFFIPPTVLALKYNHVSLKQQQQRQQGEVSDCVNMTASQQYARTRTYRHWVAPTTDCLHFGDGIETADRRVTAAQPA